AYWALPSRPVRILFAAAAVFFLGFAAWQSWFRPPDPSAHTPAWANLAVGGELFWVSVVLLVGAAAAWLRGHDRGRVWLLLAASFYFYASWTPSLACLIFASTILDFFLAHAIARLRAPGWRKALVGVSVAANIGLLCYFKYTNFFLASLEAALNRCGAAMSI